MRAILAAFAIAAPLAAQAEWSFTDTYTIASAPSNGMRMVIDCSRPGGEAQFRLDGYALFGTDTPHTGPTGFLLGDRLEDVYGAECTAGSCVIGPAPNASAAVQARQMPALLAEWRAREVVDFVEYRGGPVAAFDMTGSARAIAELEAAGCRMP